MAGGGPVADRQVLAGTRLKLEGRLSGSRWIHICGWIGVVYCHCCDGGRHYDLLMSTLATSVGLGGDGDEIVAIDDVERAFGVKLDKTHAAQWYTAGDLFASLCQALPADHADNDLWSRFTKVLTDQTGVDPQAIQKESPLLSQSRLWVNVANASAVVWIVVAGAMLALLGRALL
ncbi:hypothetical protein [Novosphingobium sp. ES2-1]|jgi:hypothetical protein|uniref:hypothetical protein n=1 Tax=Novosphingobium sp. ES2-1 TaxID=2780074 RepID=UPI0018822D26|nr:hypothetical protein [Novosphingobium sp. ES2-1]QOV96352.1 hypothetical protein IM701_18880 [Novosphingobium sp. ES2-1]